MSARQRLERKCARCFALKDFRRALRHLRELLGEVGENPQTLYMMAYCHERLAELEEALRCAERALAAQPEHLEALQLLAKIQVTREEHDRACVTVRKGIDVILERRAPSPPAPGHARAPGPLRRWLDRSRRHRGAAPEVDQAQWLDWAEAYLRHHGDAHHGE